MIIVTTPEVPNKKIIKVHGIARGSTVRARNVGRDIFAGIKNLVGGEIKEYTRLQADAREEALQRLISDARKMSANAVINVRFTTSVIMQGTSEMLAYGTAVTVN
ncbi:MAG: YbjQ family protein [Bacteroidota bacterium]|nr:YbjQ family protein [Bacteroidota bacterium]|tara:strand:+ start:671 stop:985 length:315 start_codon:yes stop_codon:yes gene_type:complete